MLPKNHLIKTGEIEHADWNYRPVLGYIQRQRFKLCLELLENNHFNNLLEIGYGAGIFIPQLKDYCENFYGIDIHNKNLEISRIFSDLEINTKLFSGSAEELPFECNFFDAIVLISSLEFINNIDKGCSEIKRVLKKDGLLFIITPGHSKILDFGLKILTGKDAKSIYKNRREKIMPALYKHFKIEKNISFPGTASKNLYRGLKLSRI